MAYFQLGKLFRILPALGALYATFIGSMLSPWVQRQVLYAHNIHTLRWTDIDTPEIYGFAPGQVTPFTIPKPDGHMLYAWHVLPLGLYADNEPAMLKQFEGRREQKVTDKLGDATEQLLLHPEARLVINFHGNAGHVAQGWRPDSFKSLSAADHTSRTHIVTFDYRGFGKSAGVPSEEGLIEDGVAVIDWAINVARVSPERIVLLGHSLGTAVATAALARYLDVARPELHQDFPFAGLLLSGGFTDITELLKTYALGGVLPLLAPVAGYSPFQRLLKSSIVDKWNTAARLQALAARCPGFRLQIMHAVDDFDIRQHHADLLFDVVIAGLQERTEEVLKTKVLEYVSGSTVVKCLHVIPVRGGESGATFVRRDVLAHGAHNRALTFAEVAIAVRRLFERIDDDRAGVSVSNEHMH